MKASDRHDESTKRVSVTALRPYRLNPRVHPPAQIEALKIALQSFGMVSPLTVLKRTMEVLGGNGRLQAIQSLGWTEVECKVIDVPDAEAAQVNVALNRLGELSSWDNQKLGDLLLESFADRPIDPLAIGFTAADLDAIVTTVDAATINTVTTTEIDSPERIDRDAPKKEADIDVSKVASIVKPGDRWCLGSHILKCEEWGSDTAWAGDTVFTHLPNDRSTLGTEQLQRLGFEHLFVVLPHWTQLSAWNDKKSSLIIWDQGVKPNPCAGYDAGQHKSIVYRGNTQRLDLTDLWRVPRDRMVGQHDRHLPVTLVVRALSDIAARRVFDPYAGSGSVLIAAEQLGVQCYAYESDAHWCDVIISRWETLTGKRARKAPQDAKASKKPSAG